MSQEKMVRRLAGRAIIVATVRCSTDVAMSAALEAGQRPASRWSPLLALLVGLTVAAGCATGRAVPTSTSGDTTRAVAVLKIKAVGIPPAVVARTRRAIGRQITAAAELRLIDSDRVDAAMRQAPSCSGGRTEQQDQCAVAIGRRTGAADVVVVALGGLGKTFIVQMRVVDVAKATVTRSLEETRFGEISTLPAASGQLSLKLFGVARPRRARAWYARWWVWATAALVAGAAVAIPVAISTRQADPYEEVPLP